MKRSVTLFLILLAGSVGAAGLPPVLEALFKSPPPGPIVGEDGTYIRDAPPTARLQGAGQTLTPILQETSANLEGMAFSGDGTRLALVEKTGLRTHGLVGKASKRFFQVGHCEGIFPGPNGCFVVNRNGAWLWNPDQPWPAQPFDKDSAACTCAAGRVALNNKGEFHDLLGKRKRRVVSGQDFYNATLAGDGSLLATFRNGHANAFGHDHGATEIYEVGTNRSLLAYDCGSYENAVAVNGDGTMVADAREDSTSVVNSEGEVMDEGTRGDGGVTLFRRKGAKYEVVCRWLPEQDAQGVAFAPDKPWLAAALGQDVYIWSVPEGRVLAHTKLDAPVKRVLVSSRRFVAASTAKGKIVVWDASRL